MYRISVVSEFSSAHKLRGYKGKCENMHGHNWKVEALVASKKLDNHGMVLDFKELKKKLNEVLEVLDHKNLNDLAYFKKVNPTSENLAKFIYDKLKTKLYAIRYTLYAIKVWETRNSCAEYIED